MILVLMGVTGSGKSTIGKLLANNLGWTFIDADDFHPNALGHERLARRLDEAMRGIPELARLWATALARLVDTPYVKSTGSSVVIQLPKSASFPETTLEWKVPRWSNTLERDRARVSQASAVTGSFAMPAPMW